MLTSAEYPPIKFTPTVLAALSRVSAIVTKSSFVLHAAPPTNAIGVTEISDCACLVVSEETGNVSVSLDGALKKYDDLATLKLDLENILGIKNESDVTNKKTIFKIDNLITIKKNEHENKQ